MAFTQADLDNIEEAIALGVTKVTVNGHTTEYADIENLLKARNAIRQALATQDQSSPACLRTCVATFHD